MKMIILILLIVLNGCATAKFYNDKGELVERVKFYGIGSAKSSHGSEIVSELGLPDYIGR